MKKQDLGLVHTESRSEKIKRKGEKCKKSQSGKSVHTKSGKRKKNNKVHNFLCLAEKFQS